MNTAELTTEVRSTTDYNIFKFYQSNRVPTMVEKIAESIKKKDLTKYLPILVNSEMYVIDGQNRLLACKLLEIPVWYVIADELKKSDMILLNSNQKPWNPDDYLNYYVAEGNPDYIRMDEIKKETGLTVSTLYALGTYTGSRDRGQKASVLFKEGKMLFKKDSVENARTIKRLIDFMINASGEQLTPRTLTNPIKSLVKNKDIDLQRIFDKISKFPFLIRKQPDGKHYMQMFEEIYNYRSRTRYRFA